MARRSRKFPLATLAGLACAVAWSHGCGIDLSKNELAGRPCKNGTCLPGYICSATNVCVLSAGASGALGTGGSAGEGGTEGTGGSTEGTGGSGGTDLDATPDVSDASDSGDDQSADANGGTAAADGSADTGDSADTGGSAGVAGDAGNRWPGVGCLQLACGPAEVCCVSDYPGYPEPPAATAFRCAEPGATCEYTLRCDGDHDCPAGQQCCVAITAGGWVVSCTANCGGNPPPRVECTKPEHCGNGLVCCAVNFQLNRFDAFLCRPSCNNLSDRRVCTAETDCPAAATCMNSAVLPGFKTCQP
jgi:hypothetical protein